MLAAGYTLAIAYSLSARHEAHIEYLRIIVRALRQKLEDDPARPRLIGNELGVGYRLEA